MYNYEYITNGRKIIQVDPCSTCTIKSEIDILGEYNYDFHCPGDCYNLLLIKQYPYIGIKVKQIFSRV